VIINLLKGIFISKNKGTKVITTSQAYFPKIIERRTVHRIYFDFVHSTNRISCLFICNLEVLFFSKKAIKKNKRIKKDYFLIKD
jgi:hypothetical protein